jgi:ABC-type dipeptide/oligopeptide/nickel transport systems, permease components
MESKERGGTWYNSKMIIGFILLGMLLLIAIFSATISPNNPLAEHIEIKYAPPSSEYWFGTDHLGRCIASRIFWGARTSLMYGGAILGSILLISLVLGLFSGYFGGWLDTVIMRMTDIAISLPTPVIALAIAGALGPSGKNLIIAMILTSWGDFTKLIRGMVLEMKEKDFILSAQVSGFSHIKTMRTHILRNIFPPIIGLATIEMGKIILTIAGFSFIGLGAQPPTPEWGVMISDARNLIQVQPQLMLYPGLAVIFTVVAFNILGEGLQQALGKGKVIRG